METASLPAIRALRRVWHKGRITDQKLPLEPRHVSAIRVRLELAENHRDLALFNMEIDSKRRGCDLVKMKVAVIIASGQISERALGMQSKTQSRVRFEISEATRSSVEKWIEDELMMGSEYLWPDRFHGRLHIRPAYMRGSLEIASHQSFLKLAPVTNTRCAAQRSRRSTRKRTICVRFAPLLLGHAKMDSKVRYPGLGLEDALAIAEAIEI